MATDKFISAIRRALIPPDQVEALAQIPGWGPAPFGDDFTPADEHTLALGGSFPQDREEEEHLEGELPQNLQGTGGSLDHQEASRFMPPDDQNEASPSKADSYDEAFEDGPDEASLAADGKDNMGLALPMRDRLDEVQPMTQDPSVDMSYAYPESAPEGLTAEEERDGEPGSRPPEGAEKLEELKEALRPEEGAKKDEGEPAELDNLPPGGNQEGEQQLAKEVRDTEAATEEPAKEGARVAELEAQRTANEAANDEEEVFQDAVAEPMSSQDTTRRKGRSKEKKQVDNNQDAGDTASAKDTAMPTLSIFPRSSTRTAAISRQVQAAVRAAESVRERSVEPGPSSIYTAATALSKNVTMLSDSTQLLRRTTRSTYVSSAVALLRAPRELPAGTEARETLKVAARAQAGLDGVPRQGAPVRDTRSQTKTGGAQAEHLEERDSQPSKQPAAQPAATNENNGKERHEGVIEGNGVQAEEGGGGKEDNGQPEERNGRTREAETDHDGVHETVAKAPEGKQEAVPPAEAANERLEQHDAAKPASLSSEQPPHGSPTSDVQATEKPQTDAPGIHAHHARPQGAAEASKSRPSRGLHKHDPAQAQPQLEQEVPEKQEALQEEATLGEAINGSQQPDEAEDVKEPDFEDVQEPLRATENAAAQQAPEMTVAEVRKRQSNPGSFAELVRLWPVKKPRQELQPGVNLLSLAVDAGLWSPPPFYRGKRPQKGD